MSQVFAEFLRKEVIDWNKLDEESQMALRRDMTRVDNFEPTKVVESELQSVDLKQIVARHIRNDLPYKAEPWWLDGEVAQNIDLQSALETVRRSQEHFDALPADVRFRFGNDPVAFMNFVQDDANKDEAIKLGLIPKPEEPSPPPEPVRVQVVADPSA